MHAINIHYLRTKYNLSLIHICHDVPAQRTRAGQLREQLSRAHIGEQAHGAADAQQALFRPLIPGHAVPLGAAHRAQQHAVRLKAGVDGRLGQGRAVVVDGHAADINKICLLYTSRCV